jgi:hypothetical protein
MMNAHTIVSLTERSTTAGPKMYARGIGIVEDGQLKLVSHKYVQNPSR